MKAAGSRYINSINHQPFKDNHVHDYTFAQTEKLFKENIQGCVVVGMVIILLLQNGICIMILFNHDSNIFFNHADEEWVQAALAPSSDAQQYCIIWLQDHFSKFGDRAPNRYETYLIITARRNIYKDYVAEFKRRNQPYVQESVFSNLWVTIFPRYINRPWCDIPGKHL